MDEDEKPDEPPMPSPEEAAKQQQKRKKEKRAADFAKLPPIDFNQINVADLYGKDCGEYYLINQTINETKTAMQNSVLSLSEIECRTCLMIFDYTRICPHLLGEVYNKEDDQNGIHAWGNLQQLM